MYYINSNIINYNMFNKKQEVKDFSAEIKNHELEIRTLRQEHVLKIKEIEANHNLEIKQKEFEMKNFKDLEILEKNKKIEDLTNKNAVLVKENEMMNKMVDINADIVDVKDIINQLIKKLPEVNLNSLTVNTTSK